jgi:hypothetical protein
MKWFARKPIASIVAIAFVASSTGCSFGYMPKSNGKIAVVVDNGSPAYVKDGRVYKGGIFGGDLDEAVAGNPKAEAELEEYKSDMTGWLATFVAGTGAMVADVVMLSNDAARRDNPSGAELGTEVGLLGAWIGLYVASVVFAVSAQPHLFDAINVYNDGVDDRAPAPGPRVAPPRAAPAPGPDDDGPPSDLR